MTTLASANESATKTPSIVNRWRFAGLSAAELLPPLQQHLTAIDADAQWQLAWLNNDGHPIIGLRPKVSWSVYFDTEQNPSTLPQDDKDKTQRYKVLTTCRDEQTLATDYMSYADWQQVLIAYSSAHNSNENENSSDHHNSSDNYNKNYQPNHLLSDPISQLTAKPSYQHGLIGFIGYDIAAAELSPALASQQPSQPCAVLGHYDIYLTPISQSINNATDAYLDKSTSGWQLNFRPATSITDKPATDLVLNTIIDALQRLDNQLTTMEYANQTAPQNTAKPSPLLLTAKWHKSDYQTAFAQTQRYLQQGDCYQINLTQVWQGSFVTTATVVTPSPALANATVLQNSDTSANSTKPAKKNNSLLDYLPALQRNTQAPFAGYLTLSNSASAAIDNNDFELLSCSPELFFTFIKDSQTQQNYILTKPIKGTAPRGATTEQDMLLKQQLIDSDKDRSENVMIVDLLRNDLGKYAKTGSVKVPQLFAIESFSNVHHMVSTISAELKQDAHPLAVLFGSLPAGSITGTPKKRAVEIIAELEVDARGAYCGTMGYMNFDGSGQWNVLIRTLQASQIATGDKQVSLWAGGGITVASDYAAEYQECLDKVGNLLAVLADK